MSNEILDNVILRMDFLGEIDRSDSILENLKKVLFALMCREVVTKKDFIEILWPDPDKEPDWAENSIGVYLYELRKKLEPFGYKIINLGYARGFKLETP